LLCAPIMNRSARKKVSTASERRRNSGIGDFASKSRFAPPHDLKETL
jgi:hypothetical protein